MVMKSSPDLGLNNDNLNESNRMFALCMGHYVIETNWNMRQIVAYFINLVEVF